MKKHIPTILLAVLCIALAAGLYSARQENRKLTEAMAALQVQAARPPVDEVSTKRATTDSAPSMPAEGTLSTGDDITHPEESIAPLQPPEEPAGRRMMKSIAQMMDNPTMNKVMEASQRGAVGALYADLIAYLDLDAKETEYFMDLLMYRQMQQMELGMKMMSGAEMTPEEKQELQDKVKEAQKLVRTEMETFLNNQDDFAEFEFYEKTMGERMMLSQMDQKLAASGETLSDEAYREVLGMMHDEKKNFTFSSNLHDDENMDLSAERFSQQNMERYTDDLDRLYAGMTTRAAGVLSPGQQEAFEAAIQQALEMQKAQIEMAGQMFGARKKGP